MGDPEVYGEIYRRHPDSRMLIFILMVGSKDSYRNSKERFAKAFAMVSANIYRIFAEPLRAECTLKRRHLILHVSLRLPESDMQ
jgi:hypothetical protein